jgi:hypothetical protein
MGKEIIIKISQIVDECIYEKSTFFLDHSISIIRYQQVRVVTLLSQNNVEEESLDLNRR